MAGPNRLDVWGAFRVREGANRGRRANPGCGQTAGRSRMGRGAPERSGAEALSLASRPVPDHGRSARPPHGIRDGAPMIRVMLAVCMLSALLTVPARSDELRPGYLEI